MSVFNAPRLPFLGANRLKQSLNIFLLYGGPSELEIQTLRREENRFFLIRGCLRGEKKYRRINALSIVTIIDYNRFAPYDIGLYEENHQGKRTRIVLDQRSLNSVIDPSDLPFYGIGLWHLKRILEAMPSLSTITARAAHPVKPFCLKHSIATTCAYSRSSSPCLGKLGKF